MLVGVKPKNRTVPSTEPMAAWAIEFSDAHPKIPPPRAWSGTPHVVLAPHVVRRDAATLKALKDSRNCVLDGDHDYLRR